VCFDARAHVNVHVSISVNMYVCVWLWFYAVEEYVCMDSVTEESKGVTCFAQTPSISPENTVYLQGC
jgi:hypothetical protein